MATIGAWIISFLASSAGQSIIAWLLPILWKYTNGKIKDNATADHLEAKYKQSKADGDAFIDDVIKMASDGLSEDEKNEIRKRRAQLNADSFNIRP